jgi:hypothetical protein
MKWPNLKLKTRPKQLLGSLPLAFVLPGGMLRAHPHFLLASRSLVSQRERESEGDREREKETERGRKREGESERDREREREKERERERCRIWLLHFYF